jgi:hypothetical protein
LLFWPCFHEASLSPGICLDFLPLCSHHTLCDCFLLNYHLVHLPPLEEVWTHCHPWLYPRSPQSVCHIEGAH